MGKQIVHDWSSGELVVYEIEADDPIIELPQEETIPE